jgi:hypothetical protein
MDVDRPRRTDAQRRERLTGAEVKTLCSHPVVDVDPPPTPTLPPALAPEAQIGSGLPTYDVLTYDPQALKAAHTRYLTEPKGLTDDDLAQFAIVDPTFAERARAKRAGFVEGTTANEERVGMTVWVRGSRGALVSSSMIGGWSSMASRG